MFANVILTFKLKKTDVKSIQMQSFTPSLSRGPCVPLFPHTASMSAQKCSS